MMLANRKAAMVITEIKVSDMIDSDRRIYSAPRLIEAERRILEEKIKASPPEEYWW